MKTKIEKVSLNGFSMKFFRFGKGEKTMVIIPGLSVQSVMGLSAAISREYDVMKEDFTVFVIDRREELPPVYTVVDMADDTVKVIEALGLRDIFLFGTSQGGMIAMKIALERPDLVSKLALGSTVSEVPDDRFGLIEKWIRLAKERKKTELYLSFGEAIFPQSVFKKQRLTLMLAAKTVSARDLERFTILAEGIRGFNVTDRLDEIRCPTLVICSRDDKVLGEEAAELTEKALKDRQNISLYFYDGYGHAAYDTAPDYRERIHSFFVK